MTNDIARADWSAAEWHDKWIEDCDGQRIGRLQDVYVDVETDVPQFATVREGLLERHLTFVPLNDVHVGPEALRVNLTRELVRSAPNIELHGEELTQVDESALYHHFGMNYTEVVSESGRRLARR